jgi:hypothetical protein
LVGGGVGAEAEGEVGGLHGLFDDVEELVGEEGKVGIVAEAGAGGGGSDPGSPGEGAGRVAAIGCHDREILRFAQNDRGERSE